MIQRVTIVYYDPKMYNDVYYDVVNAIYKPLGDQYILVVVVDKYTQVTHNMRYIQKVIIEEKRED